MAKLYVHAGECIIIATENSGSIILSVYNIILTYVAEEVIGSNQGRRNIVVDLSGTSSYRHD